MNNNKMFVTQGCASLHHFTACYVGVPAVLQVALPEAVGAMCGGWLEGAEMLLFPLLEGQVRPHGCMGA